MNTELAQRIRSSLAANKNIEEKPMFGGICFMLNGNMTVAARRNASLLARIGGKETERAVAEPGVEHMMMRGREMKDYVVVASDRLDDAALQKWIGLALAFVGALPAKG
ncbi:MAG TPA: TfoX/Sxy family protein [Rhizobiaceae bacterium]|nr:TfoX/Sxy family protein [Rhizobiaceae bacterium]